MVTQNEPTLDFGVLKSKASASTLRFFAPSAAVRGVWLLGALGCLVFLWSIVTSLGWLEFSDNQLTGGRFPTIIETVFWLLPLILAFVFGMMALGGVRVVLGQDALHIRQFAPRKRDLHFTLDTLHYARFYPETTKSGEALYACVFVFEGRSVQFFIANKAIWQRLRARFDPNFNPERDT
jgi:hypothetical protein